MVATRNGSIPMFLGHVERAALLELLSSQQTDLIKIFHEGNDIRPYALTPLAYKGHYLIPRDGYTYIQVKQGERYAFSMTFISPYYFQQTIEIMLNLNHITLILKDIPFSLESININTTPILTVSNPAETVPVPFHYPNVWNIKFLSPTQFKQKNNLMSYFPIPEQIFSSLYRLWEKYLPLPTFFIKEEWETLIHDHCFCRAHNIRTMQFYVGKGPMEVGFIGWAQLVCTNRSTPFVSFLTALLELGQAMNVGSKRTQGFGVMSYDIYVQKSSTIEKNLPKV